MRSLRAKLYPGVGIRVNAFCPWLVPTAMTAGLEGLFRNAELPINELPDVAQRVAEVCCDKTLNGKALYLEGGRAWDVEEGIDRTQPQWLGERQTADLQRGDEILASVS